MYRLELTKVCDHVTRSCTCTDRCLSSHILSMLLAIILHGGIYTSIPTTLFISTDNLLVLLEDAHESQSSNKPLVKTQEKSPQLDVPQNDNCGTIGQDILGSLTPDKEQFSPVQTQADKGLYMHTFFKLLSNLF